MGTSGILNVNKDAGCTSFSVVAAIRRLTGEKRVGHAGTLDPAATGVLPVCMGYATRIVEYLSGQPKEYVALVELGTTTDSFDSEGRITGQRQHKTVTMEAVQSALRSFVGTITQVPPAFSAVKIKGKRSYDLARAGIQATPPPRTVRIDGIDMLSFDSPYLQIRVRCSKGTYIRSLANDVGEVLGCGAYLKALTRTACGPFGIAEAQTLEVLRARFDEGRFDSLVYPCDYPLEGWRREDLSEEASLGVIRGRDILLDAPLDEAGPLRRAYGPQGFLAILRFVPETGKWHPDKVTPRQTV